MSNIKHYWHEIPFKIKILENSHKYKDINQADSPIHSLIAYEVLKPIIKKYEKDFLLWRFHRTFKPKDDSHLFRLKFYSEEGLDSGVTEFIKSNEHYKIIKKEDLLKLEQDQDVTCEKLANEQDIKDDSDPGSSDEIKEIWPYYIHGVSRAWLRFIEVFIKKEKPLNSTASFREQLDYYTRINRLIEEKWTKNSEHPMLHHLNAVFGYKYINIMRPQDFIKNINQILVPLNKILIPAFQMDIKF